MEIQSILPHRPPFLFVDGVTEVNPGQWVKGYKYVNWNDWLVKDSSGQYYWPDMLIVEAIAQVSAFATDPVETGLGLLGSIKEVEFLSRVGPGERIELFFEVTRVRGPLIKGRGVAYVNDRKVVSVGEIGIFLSEGS